MLLGRFGVGTYSPIALVLVAGSVSVCARGLATAGKTPVPTDAPTGWRHAVTVMIVLYLGLALATLLWIPAERVDVYLFQRDAAAALLHGIDPYSITHQNLYVHAPSFFYGPGLVKQGRVDYGFQYPPLSLFSILPGYLLGDLRYTYVAALVISAVLLLRIRYDRVALIAVALLLLSPVTLYVLSRGWTEPLVLVTLYWTCLAAIRRSRWLPIALGFFFASKQYTVLVVPLTGLLLPRFAWKAYFRLNLAGAAVAAAITVPLAFWHWHDFWRGVVVWQFLQPFRPDALSASVLAVRLGFPQIPQALVIAVVFLTIAWSLRVTRPRPSAFPGCVALVLLCFFALNKQAFVNYYFLVIGAVLLAAVLHDRPVPLTTTCIEPPATRLQT